MIFVFFQRIIISLRSQTGNSHFIGVNYLIFKGLKLSIFNMAHHKSALKRIRQNEKRRLQNRYYKKSARTAIKKLRELKDAAEAQTFLPKIVSMLDRLAKRGNIHRNKAANLKSGLAKHVNALAAAN